MCTAERDVNSCERCVHLELCATECAAGRNSYTCHVVLIGNKYCSTLALPQCAAGRNSYTCHVVLIGNKYCSTLALPQ